MRRPQRPSIVDAADQLAALQHLDLDPAEADVEAGLVRVEHLVAALDPVRLGADGCDDPVRQATVEAADAGRISPARVSVSSLTGWMTMYSSSGSSVWSMFLD